MKIASAIFIVVLLGAVLWAPAAEAGLGQYSCLKCNQICFGLLSGCEWFCMTAPNGGFEECYAYADFCQQFEQCYYYMT